MTQDTPGNVNYNPGASDNVAKKAEEFSNRAQDAAESMKEQTQQLADETPKTPEEFINQKGFTAWHTAEKVREKQQNKKDQDKFQVDLDKYLQFCDRSCSGPSKNVAEYLDRLRQLEEQGCNIQRLDTAAAGISAEGGEFMEIVKKMKFQGKPWNDANKEHLIKELGDVMWYVAQACIALDVRLDDVVYTNTLKLAARYPDGEFSVEHSENRKVGDI
ncbi:nucleoside triphosphate pyrophosphohydrolase [Synechococcus phage S-SZBM1]|uniref:Nucleoside triphosphate pyrophosphohydrolase n=1 Tax=Synechococcus phage S-SZBM1 TaxID=2926475 RepID=A0AC61TSP5_9CAUD|nr:MazG-like pyrophosphatase [Synechococcus phage S-SZBM1]UNH61261.1 nucleoside triphosphate pyrophosphohydrolase [Synechococcus phage S-SZBM1]